MKFLLIALSLFVFKVEMSEASTCKLYGVQKARGVILNVCKGAGVTYPNLSLEQCLDEAHTLYKTEQPCSARITNPFNGSERIETYPVYFKNMKFTFTDESGVVTKGVIK
jgi:hypothetical protein